MDLSFVFFSLAEESKVCFFFSLAEESQESEDIYRRSQKSMLIFTLRWKRLLFLPIRSLLGESIRARFIRCLLSSALLSSLLLFFSTLLFAWSGGDEWTRSSSYHSNSWLTDCLTAWLPDFLPLQLPVSGKKNSGNSIHLRRIFIASFFPAYSDISDILAQLIVHVFLLTVFSFLV